ncbi:MAG: hypothetical protein IMF11_16060, partial [Proteobacteria bacterium]|nr:hypothetical protein [Pseudomonadota bacterium]
MKINKAEQSNKKQIRNFLICAWNGLKKTVDKYDKTYCLQAKWKQDKLAEAVKRMLKSWGLEAVNSERDADLIVLVPRHSDLPYQISDARIFHRMLCGSRKHVLLIDRLGTLSVPSEIWPEWFYCIKDASFDSSDSSKFTQWIKQYRLTQRVQSFRSSNYRNLGCKLLAGNKYKFPTLLIMTESDKLSRSGTCLLLSDKLSQFFYGLLRMSCRYDRLEHDMNRDISDVFTSEPEPLRRTNQQKKMLDFCVDLKRALRVSIHKKTNNANAAENNGKLILVIDDCPNLIHKQIKKIQEIFFPNFKIYFWEPKQAQKKDELCLSDIEKYNSLAESELVLKKTMPSWSEKKEQNGHLSLKTVLSHTRFAIVDILFPDDKGKDKPKGIAVIRGLQRLALDLSKNEAAKGAAQEQDAELFDIVALSRADDMDKIQPALQAGARGYVLKSRPLALPGVLGELETSIREPITKLHRNFRSLYNLPNETTRLLQTATIPPNLSFHVSTQENEQGGKTENRKSRIQAALPMADILAAIPKADLHVHVGSCMSPEFLVIASLVMLVRHNTDSTEFLKLQEAIPNFDEFWNNNGKFKFQAGLNIDQQTKGETLSLDLENKKGIQNLAQKTRDYLNTQIDSYKKSEKNDGQSSADSEDCKKAYKLFRSILHKDLNLPDHMDEQRLKKGLADMPNVILFQFAMTHSGPEGNPLITDKDDLLRIFLLFLAANKYNGDSRLEVLDPRKDCLSWFEPQKAKINNTNWKAIHDRFWSFAHKKKSLSHETFRRNNWELKPSAVSGGKIELFRDNVKNRARWPLNDLPKYDEDPITYLLASGTRCNNLKTYLEGCEYAGAEHLRHPFLIHLYAQQTVHNFIRHGVIYAELRAAVSGYENREINFTFQDACNCLQEAFHNAQHAILKEYHETRIKKDEGGKETSEENKPVWLWEEPFVIKALFKKSNSKQSRRSFPLFPVKVSLILTGKRHKPTRQMLREAASATVLHTLPSSNIKTAQEFATEDMDKCRLVGFDLAGQEDDDYAPHLFRSEFEQIS